MWCAILPYYRLLIRKITIDLGVLTSDLRLWYHVGDIGTKLQRFPAGEFIWNPRLHKETDDEGNIYGCLNAESRGII